MLPWLLTLGLFDAIDLGVAVLLTLAVVEGRLRPGEGSSRVTKRLR